ncbi:MAG: hypothetical protein WA584_10550 [Pyrinomonadaceae bacterium]
MAISNKDLEKMDVSHKDLYIQLRQALNSFSDVVILEFEKTISPSDREEFSGKILGKIQKLLNEIADDRQFMWRNLNSSRANDFEKHANDLRELAKEANRDKVSACPPGFIEIDGICVPI